MVENERRPGVATENKMVGKKIGWIRCRESLICLEGDFEDDAIMD